LGEAAREEGLNLSQSAVQTVVVAGEPGAGIPATRERILNLWQGATLKDHHGMTETGPVTYECPSRQGVLHVAESAFLPEVRNPHTLEPVAAGEQGELILTTLRRVGSPLLRYRTGDLVLPSTELPCVCGRHDLALEGGILGRVDDMVVVRGVNLHPSAIETVLREFAQIAEYRVELCIERAMWEARIQIEPVADCPNAESLRQDVETALRAVFNLRIPVVCTPVGSLPRFELKARRWIRLESQG
jgi:phenylacetate-CoA ligase